MKRPKLNALTIHSSCGLIGAEDAFMIIPARQACNYIKHCLSTAVDASKNSCP